MARNQLSLKSECQRYFFIVYIIFLIALSGCENNNFSDLNQYIARVKSEPKESIQPLPKVIKVESFEFKLNKQRDPFEAIDQYEFPNTSIDQSDINGVKPDIKRPKEELEAFPLESLKMVGTVITKSILWGLIKADNGTIYRVQNGNYMGKNYGKIINISTNKIELLELVSYKPGFWREQHAVLMLIE
jgi:type IV pilus assembly protein PilP